MADLNFYSVTEDTLSKVNQLDGNVIFVRDSKKIIVDTVGTRVVYNTIVLLPSDEIRLLMTPVDGFYFVEDTHILYRCDGKDWIPLTEKPTKEILFFDSEENLPAKAEEDILYTTNNSIYRWINNEYIDLTLQQWESL